MKLNYQITVRWSAEDDAYEARVPALRGCLGYGTSPAAAVREVTTAARLWLKAAQDHGKPIPAPDATLERLAALAPILNMARVAREAGLSRQTIASKISRGTALSEDERAAVSAVLASHGM